MEAPPFDIVVPLSGVMEYSEFPHKSEICFYGTFTQQ